MLHCRSVTLAVPGRVLCSDLDVSFAPGQVWAVLGRNGTGKSTLIHALAGLQSPAAGSVELDGEALSAFSAKERAKRIGVLLQIEEGTYWGSAAEYVLLGRYPHVTGWTGYGREDHCAATEALETMRLDKEAARAVSTLSGGERQRVRIAQVLAQAPKIVLMDEPLQHLDVAHQAHVLALVARRARERNEIAVMVLHEPMWIARACTHALVFEGDGKVRGGRAGDVLTKARLEHAYGCALQEVNVGGGRCFVPNV